MLHNCCTRVCTVLALCWEWKSVTAEIRGYWRKKQMIYNQMMWYRADYQVRESFLSIIRISQRGIHPFLKFLQKIKYLNSFPLLISSLLISVEHFNNLRKNLSGTGELNSWELEAEFLFFFSCGYEMWFVYSRFWNCCFLKLKSLYYYNPLFA